MLHAAGRGGAQFARGRVHPSLLYSATSTRRRRSLAWERRRLASSRRRLATPLGRVGLRAFGGCQAASIKFCKRSLASRRLPSWVRWRRASIRRTPSLLARLPANRSSRALTASGNEREARTSKRSRTAVATLLTFWPPGPEARKAS